MSRRSFLAQTATLVAFAPALAACSASGGDFIGQGLSALMSSGVVQQPTFDVVGFGIESLSLQSQVLRIDTQVTNPNPLSLTFNSIDLSVNLAGLDLGQAQAQQSFEVPANASVTVPLTLNVNMIQLLNQSVGLLNVRMDTPLPYAITGQVNVSQLNIPVPVNIQGSVTPDQMVGLAQLLAQVTNGFGTGISVSGQPSASTAPSTGGASGSLVNSLVNGILGAI